MIGSKRHQGAFIGSGPQEQARSELRSPFLTVDVAIGVKLAMD